jgi:hypothetical protein
MPAFGLPNYAQGIVFVPVAATGAAAAYTAKANDVVVCAGGATGPACTITLPTIVGLLPPVATQSDPQWSGATGATGSVGYFPVSPNADDVKVVVTAEGGATGAQLPKVVSADGSLINGASGGTGLSLPTSGVSLTFVSKGGNWYTL